MGISRPSRVGHVLDVRFGFQRSLCPVRIDVVHQVAVWNVALKHQAAVAPIQAVFAVQRMRIDQIEAPYRPPDLAIAERASPQRFVGPSATSRTDLSLQKRMHQPLLARRLHGTKEPVSVNLNIYSSRRS